MIRAEGLRKHFGEVAAVDGVSFSAPNGEITGLLGPNGAGKSTTLRMTYGLLRPDAGSVHVDDHDVRREPELARRRLGVLPDSRGLYARLSAREHVRYFGQLHGVRGDALEARVDQLVQLLDMATIADRRTDGFSTGERTKVALARTLVHDPPNVILDEPTNGLDVLSARAVRRLMQQLRDEGRCVVFSSHILHEVALLCDRVVIIAHGKVAAVGTPEELRERTGKADLEDVFVELIGSEEGLAER